MGDKSKIQWTDATWNPVTGCDKVSNGCANCYAEVVAERMQKHPNPKVRHRYRNGFGLTTHPDMLDQPLRWKKPRRIFVNSMSDLFHEKLELSFIQKVFLTMCDAHWHQFQVLTKRPVRLLQLRPQLPIEPNIWLGTTVESGRYTHRIEALAMVDTPGPKFVSFEPLIAPVPEETDLTAIDWAIVGGESGPNHRPLDPEWARAIQRACRRDGVAFFFKQWGGLTPKSGGRELDGRTWDEYPEDGGRG